MPNFHAFINSNFAALLHSKFAQYYTTTRRHEFIYNSTPCSLTCARNTRLYFSHTSPLMTNAKVRAKTPLETFHFFSPTTRVQGWAMEMASSTINNLISFVRRRDLLCDVDDGIGRLKFHRYGLSILASSYRFWIFYQDCHEEDAPRNFLS
jgi:hypothetical protein